MYTYLFFKKEYNFSNFCRYLLLRKVPYNLVIEPLFVLTNKISFRNLRSFVSWSLGKRAKENNIFIAWKLFFVSQYPQYAHDL